MIVSHVESVDVQRQVHHLTLYTLTDISTHIPQAVLRTSSKLTRRNIFNTQELLYLVIISFILLTLICDSGVIM